VSRLSNNRLLLTVTAGGLRAALWSRWPRRRRRAAAECDWRAAAAQGQPAGAPDLATALERVLGQLAGAAALRGLPLDIELSDALVHLDVAPGDFAGHSEPQLGAVARACFRELLGEAIDAHALRWQLQGDERHLLMCAAPTALLDELTRLAVRHGLRLRTVHTQFEASWNQRSAALQAGIGIFASGHGEDAVVAFVRAGVIEALSRSSYPAEREAADAPLRLDGHVARLVASLGVDATQVQRFIAVDDSATAGALSSRWQFFERAEAVA
jgi:hypothetical protein